MRVLLTGFGPFPGAPVNPSGVLALKLARRRRPALAGIERIVHVFATTYAAVDRDLPRLFAKQPDIVLMFGLAGRTPYLRVETRARNAISQIFPDAGGHRPQRHIIAHGAPASLRGAAPFARLVAALRASGVPARLSHDAGRYLCNYGYWSALQRAPQGKPLVQFVHIPVVRIGSRRRRSKHPPLSLSQIIRAAENLLIALLAAARR